LGTGIYTIPVTGYYHVYATISLFYTPLAGAASYNNINNFPMTLRFLQIGQQFALLAASFFSYSYAGVGGPGNNNGVITYDTATLSGDVLLYDGTGYQLEILNPFVDATVVSLMTGGLGSFGAYTRWSMRQFASDF
jgi:hypothetical protein